MSFVACAVVSSAGDGGDFFEVGLVLSQHGDAVDDDPGCAGIVGCLSWVAAIVPLSVGQEHDYFAGEAIAVGGGEHGDSAIQAADKLVPPMIGWLALADTKVRIELELLLQSELPLEGNAKSTELAG